MTMGWVAGGIAVAGLASAYMGSQASQSAANTQANAANNATAANTAALNKQIELNQPFVNAGYTATNALSGQAPFNPNTFNYQADPGYAFRLDQGNKALNASAAARGGLISGNALQAATNYGQAAGSQEYQNAYNRYVQGYGINTSNNQFLANLGQNSANNTGAAIGNTAASNSANTIGAGNALAAGTVGSANAYTSALNNGVNAYQTNSLINSIRNNNNTTAYSTPTTLTPGANSVLNQATV
jgi:hypothetical protein